MPQDIEQLQAQRARLYRELSQIGDLRRGSIAVNYRRCGKPNCACCGAKHPGHGPQYLLMTKVGGQSRAKNLRPGPELKKAEREVANHQRFREVVQQIVEVNEQICRARPVGEPSESPERTSLKKNCGGHPRRSWTRTRPSGLARPSGWPAAWPLGPGGHRNGHPGVDA